MGEVPTAIKTDLGKDKSFNLVQIGSQLLQNQKLWQNNTGAAFKYLLEQVCFYLDLQAANIWLEDDSQTCLYCEITHNTNKNLFIDRSKIEYTQYPQFFDNIQHSSVLLFDQQHQNIKNNIFDNSLHASALLTINKQGQAIGVISLSAKSQLKTWQPEEHYFLITIASLASQIIAQNTLYEHEQLYRTLFNNLGDASFVLADNTVVDCNPAALTMFRCTAEQIIGKAPKEFSPALQPNGQSSVEQSKIKTLLALKGKKQSFEWLHRRYDGTTFIADVTLSSIEINAIQYIIATVRDISDRKQKEESIQKMHAMQQAIFDAASYGIISTNREGIIQTFNKSAEKLLGYHANDVINKESLCLFHEPIEILETPGFGNDNGREHNEELTHKLLGNAKHGGIEEREWVYITKNGERFPGQLSLTALKEENGDISGYIGIVSDITEQKIAERDLLRSKQELEYRANHDDLTGLPNRSRLHENASTAIQLAEIQKHKTALLLLDLNRFKEVNDTLGHYAGDQLLQKLANRIRECLDNHQSQLYRLGGDEFAIIIPSVKTITDALVIGEEVNESLRKPIEVEGVTLELGGSIGVACYPDHGDNSDALLRCADVAMYRAKNNVSNTLVYDPCLDSHTPRRLSIMSELGKAIREDQLILYFQPRVDLNTNRCVGCEALVRWQHPTLGLIEPEEFIPLAEMSDLIRPLSMWVLRSALHHLRLWHQQGFELTVSVNVSTRNLLDLNYPEQLKQLLDEYQIAPQYLDIEITESAIISDPDRSLKVVDKIHELGVCLAIDDFGTGYSSLSYLKRLPVQLLKIDRSFVQDLTHDEHDATIVSSTISLAHSFNLKVVAEGVESIETFHELKQLSCEYGQGYYFKYPVPNHEFISWLKVQDFEG